MKTLFFSSLLCLSFASCNKNNSNSIEVTGIIQAQGITTYQYGTHVMPGYALRSNTIELDDYIGQTVTIVGYKIDGYPVENGPDYIEVEEVK